MPTKEDLKAKYKIETDDFEVLTRLPTKAEREARGGMLIKLGEALGAEEWMWKNFLGVLLAIIIIVPSSIGLWDFWQPKVVYSCNQISFYMQKYKIAQEKEDSGFIAFAPGYEQQREITHDNDPVVLPTGSLIMPVSGSGMA